MIGYFEGVLINQDLSLPEPQITSVGEDKCDVVFTYRPDRPARTVHLAGTFNEWNSSSHPLTGPDAEGRYQTRLTLKHGTYRYKYVIDGDYWTPDPASPRLIGVLHDTLLVVEGTTKKVTLRKMHSALRLLLLVTIVLAVPDGTDQAALYAADKNAIGRSGRAAVRGP